MDVIVLTVFGFILLGFITYWAIRHHGKAEAFLEGSNQNVMPLLREKSVQLKQALLHESFADNPVALQILDKLKRDYTDGVITIETYEAELTNLQELFNNA